MSRYEVPGMTLIRQAKSMSCWYASAQMLVKWRQLKDRQSLKWLVPPEYDFQSALLRDGNSGLVNNQILSMAQRLGLKSVPPMSPSPEMLEVWLRNYGPLWVNGQTHIVVLAGIDTETLEVKVYDPAPGVPVQWRSLETWYAFGTSASTRDTGSDVEAVFLYVPRN